MHDLALSIAVVWASALVAAQVLVVALARDALERILALDLGSFAAVGLLAVFAGAERSAAFLDAALAIVLLSFISTVAAARFAADSRPLS